MASPDVLKGVFAQAVASRPFIASPFGQTHGMLTGMAGRFHPELIMPPIPELADELLDSGRPLTIGDKPAVLPTIPAEEVEAPVKQTRAEKAAETRANKAAEKAAAAHEEDQVFTQATPAVISLPHHSAQTVAAVADEPSKPSAPEAEPASKRAKPTPVAKKAPAKKVTIRLPAARKTAPKPPPPKAIPPPVAAPVQPPPNPPPVVAVAKKSAAAKKKPAAALPISEAPLPTKRARKSEPPAPPRAAPATPKAKQRPQTKRAKRN